MLEEYCNDVTTAAELHNLCILPLANSQVVKFLAKGKSTPIYVCSATEYAILSGSPVTSARIISDRVHGDTVKHILSLIDISLTSILSPTPLHLPMFLLIHVDINLEPLTPHAMASLVTLYIGKPLEDTIQIDALKWYGTLLVISIN